MNLSKNDLKQFVLDETPIILVFKKPKINEPQHYTDDINL